MRFVRRAKGFVSDAKVDSSHSLEAVFQKEGVSRVFVELRSHRVADMQRIIENH